MRLRAFSAVKSDHAKLAESSAGQIMLKSAAVLLASWHCVHLKVFSLHAVNRQRGFHSGLTEGNEGLSNIHCPIGMLDVGHWTVSQAKRRFPGVCWEHPTRRLSNVLSNKFQLDKCRTESVHPTFSLRMLDVGRLISM